ncbi:hypothetical protein [Prevotella pallens]
MGLHTFSDTTIKPEKRSLHTFSDTTDSSRPYIIHNPTNTQQNTGYIIFSKHTTRFIHCVNV